VAGREEVWAAVDELASGLVELGRKLHARPEVAFREFFATELLSGFLREAGFRTISPWCGLETAFCAFWPSEGKQQAEKPAPAVAYLAEYDALPDLGHACGHNLIAAASVGAGAALAAVAGDKGRVLVLGTPAEEGGGGKVRLAEAGAFAGLDAALMFHPSCRTQLVRRSLAMVALEVSYHGRAAHAAAAPHLGRNALDGVVLAFSGIGALRQQLRDEVRIHGVITAGGKAPNVIPDFAAASFMVRALDEAYLAEVVRRVEGCLRGAAEASGTEVHIQRIGPAYAPFRPNYPLVEVFRRELALVGVEEAAGADEYEGMASTDVGNVSQLLPTLHPEVAICREDVPGHSPEFAAAANTAEAYEVMLRVCKALASTGLAVLSDGKLRKRMWKEFRRGSE